eukprot:1159944-Pelagomonas_calceolata.AAC.4
MAVSREGPGQGRYNFSHSKVKEGSRNEWVRSPSQSNKGQAKGECNVSHGHSQRRARQGVNPQSVTAAVKERSGKD